MTEEKISAANHYKCTGCGADLTYAPGTTHLKCSYCATEMDIAIDQADTEIQETDFELFLSENDISSEDKEQIHTVQCKSCGATTTLSPNVTSDHCAFCNSPVVIKDSQLKTIIKPKYLLPFKIEQKSALESFKKWIKKLWFAPNKLKKFFYENDKLHGVYIPYWTYDSNTSSDYRGERGTNHTESYTVTVNGKSERRTRTVIHWRPVSGHVNNCFDDVLVLASTSLPQDYANKLEPWDLSNLTPYNAQFLSGFKTESYQVNLQSGFEIAKSKMNEIIRAAIRRDIGGDHQRVHAVSTKYNDTTFKHILLPIWISAYKFQNKMYRFMINGRTGEVQGERPWSWIKITLAILGVSAVITAFYFGYHYYYQ
jgi:LSD1 subclass zinc finger protein